MMAAHEAQPSQLATADTAPTSASGPAPLELPPIKPTLPQDGHVVPSALKKKKKKKKSGRIPRPMNSFMCFAREYRPRIQSEHPGIDNKDVSKLLGQQWRSLTSAQKQVYNEQAKELAVQHKLDHPEWRFTRDTSKRKKRSKHERVFQDAAANRIPSGVTHIGDTASGPSFEHKFAFKDSNGQYQVRTALISSPPKAKEPAFASPVQQSIGKTQVQGLPPHSQFSPAPQQQQQQRHTVPEQPGPPSSSISNSTFSEHAAAAMMAAMMASSSMFHAPHMPLPPNMQTSVGHPFAGQSPTSLPPSFAMSTAPFLRLPSTSTTTTSLADKSDAAPPPTKRRPPPTYQEHLHRVSSAPPSFSSVFVP
eukprot:m.352498 g.352498  ORF g.352498 m.352498 type:complete len:363 (+) comp16535_c0_seq1:563-1651(+)